MIGNERAAAGNGQGTSGMQTYAVTLKLEGSEMLLQALDDHMRTCEVAKTLVWERDALAAEIADLKRRYENQA